MENLIKNQEQQLSKYLLGSIFRELIDKSQQNIDKKYLSIMSLINEMKEENNQLISKGK